MTEIMTMGEIIDEIMRSSVRSTAGSSGHFQRSLSLSAPAIFIDTVARLGHGAAIVGGVGEDDFGKCLLDRLERDGVDCSCIIKNDRISTGCAFVTYFSDGERKFIFHIGQYACRAGANTPCRKIAGFEIFSHHGLFADGGYFLRAQDRQDHGAGCRTGRKITFDPNIRPELLKDPEALELVSAVLEQTNIFLPGKR